MRECMEELKEILYNNSVSASKMPEVCTTLAPNHGAKVDRSPASKMPETWKRGLYNKFMPRRKLK
jgi:hypothetical protein